MRCLTKRVNATKVMDINRVDFSATVNLHEGPMLHYNNGLGFVNVFMCVVGVKSHINDRKIW